MDLNNWFVLQVSTGREKYLKELIVKRSIEKIDIMVFESELLFKRQGEFKKVNRNMFPGYIFVHKKPNVAISTVKNWLRVEFIRHVCLQTEKCDSCFGHSSPCMVSADEMALMCSISDGNGLIPLSYGITVGNEIVIISGPLKSLQGTIVSINNKKKIAMVKLVLFKQSINIPIGFDVIENNDVKSIHEPLKKKVGKLIV